MKGIELSRLFYQNVVSPWLDKAFPDLPYDAGIFGYGSELLGFDDGECQEFRVRACIV